MSNFKEMGRLTRNFEIVQAGKGVISKSAIAYPKTYKNKKGEYETNFIDIYIWGESFAKKAHSYTKGKRVLVTGDLEVDKYTGQDGTTRTAVKIKCDSYRGCILLDYNNNNGNDTRQYSPEFNNANNYNNSNNYNNANNYNNNNGYNNANNFNDFNNPNEMPDFSQMDPSGFQPIGDDDDIPF